MKGFFVVSFEIDKLPKVPKSLIYTLVLVASSLVPSLVYWLR